MDEFFLYEIYMMVYEPHEKKKRTGSKMGKKKNLILKKLLLFIHKSKKMI
jgi:hypothetical protein